MIISAVVKNSAAHHEIEVTTGGVVQSLSVGVKASGRGCAINGGEFLMLALATCYCNDLFREAQRLGLAIDSVEVQASAEFAGVGLAATNIRYRASVQSAASREDVDRLIRETDAVAEVHNTIRAGVPVQLQAG